MGSSFSLLNDKISALKSENFFFRALNTEPVALQAIVSFSGAFRKLLNATLSYLKLSVRSTFSFAKITALPHGLELIK